MNDILDNPKEPHLSTTLARAIGLIESLSIVMLFVGLLLTLQSWPYGMEARLIYNSGLALVYLGLFTMRLNGLRTGLIQAQYLRLLFAGVSLGTVFFAGALLIVNQKFFYLPILVWVSEALRVLGFIGVGASLFFGYIQPQDTNPLSDAIYTWLSIRLWLVAILGVLILVTAFN